MFCAVIPIAAATGAKLNADQRRKPAARQWPIGPLTAAVVALLVISSALYHTLSWRS
jgi:NhaP-type Na+/H+ or K+/H+ antiporter